MQAVIDSRGQLGVLASSERFKKAIQPMDRASEAILQLNPVRFSYKNDNTNTAQFGLIAEQVAQVDPDLVVRDKEGNPYSVRYDQVNAMLLNEFLKEHKAFVREQHKVEKLEAAVATLVATVKEQAARIQKVSAQLQLSKSARQTVSNNR
jgi:endosialidase-like protein